MKTRIAALILIAGLAGPAWCSYFAYTRPADYQAAVSGYINSASVNFDAQAALTPATSYGPLSIASLGLDSDGLSWLTLNPYTTAALPAASSPNSLGCKSTGEQYLAGNGDIIQFSFSSPVHAFGVYLIGDPSPTGDPAIPFWRMEVNRFSAYSATDPLYTINEGNDVYFLGVVSTDQPFSQVTLRSDNDPDACFSFNLDDISYASLPDLVSINQAKSMASGYVRVSAVVTRVHGDRFNIEYPNRLAGIAIRGTGALRGSSINLLGNITSNTEGERMIELTQILEQTESTAPKPLGMVSQALGGFMTNGLQIGVDGGRGLNNIGLDAAYWGKITAIAPDYTWMIVDDSGLRPLINGYTGAIIIGNIDARSRRIGQLIRVQGSISLINANGTHLPVIRVAQPSDIN